MIHVYHGEGKGKTTAAAGLALRAVGNGLKVVFLQFLKARPSGEIAVFSRLSGITVLRNNVDYGFYKNMTEEQKKQILAFHNQNIRKAYALIEEGSCDVLILDEVFPAYRYGLLEREAVRHILSMAEEGRFELVMTGRNPEAVFTERADYITEMRKERHPFDQGVTARKGIEY